MEAYGTLDELNAHLGLLAASLGDSNTIGFIEGIESCIFAIGGHLANENSNESPVNEGDIERLEHEIDIIRGNMQLLIAQYWRHLQHKQ